MNKTFILQKIVPNIAGLPILISEDHALCYSEKGRKFSAMHTHHEIELLYIFEGNTTIELYDGSIYFATKGDIVCINSNTPHTTYATEKGLVKHGLIQFNADAFENSKKIYNEALSIISKKPAVPVYISKDDELHKICDNTFNWMKTKKTSKNLYAASGIYAILAFLYDINFVSDYTSDINLTKLERLTPALEYISENYGEDVSLPNVSSTINMSSYYFCRFFKETLGISFSEYLKALRVKKAECELIETEKSVLEIAFENGFSSASYFNKVFKELRFCSPSEYRKFYKESIKLIKPF